MPHEMYATSEIAHLAPDPYLHNEPFARLLLVSNVALQRSRARSLLDRVEKWRTGWQK